MAKLYFSSSLYRTEAIERTVAAYSSLAVFEIETQEDGVNVSISQMVPELREQLVDAFCNHVLNETIIVIRKERGGEL